MIEFLLTLFSKEHALLGVLVLIGLCVFYELVVEVLNQIEKLPAADKISAVVNLILPVLITLAGVLGGGDQVQDATRIATEVAAAFGTFLATQFGTWLVHQIMKLVRGEAVLGILKKRGAFG